MLEEEKLYNFTMGLQSWAQIELRRQKGKDLHSTMDVANGLIDFKTASSSNDRHKKKEKSKKKESGAGKTKDDQSSYIENDSDVE